VEQSISKVRGRWIVRPFRWLDRRSLPIVALLAVVAALVAAGLAARGGELAVLRGEVVPEGGDGCGPSEGAVGSVVIVEVDEPGIGPVALTV